jgi:type II secretory pathway component GspD/PulD (secretin)
MKLASGFPTVTLAMVLSGTTAWAQAVPDASKPSSDVASAKQSATAATARGLPCSVEQAAATERTFYLNNAVQQSDSNELVTALRNFLDACDRVYLVSNQSAILIQAPPDHIAYAQKLINDLDRPKRTYRLTYTVTEMDGGKRGGVQHFAMVVASGQATTLKQGSRVPMVSGSYSEGNSGASTPQTQFTYLDVGINFDATLDEFANGVRLRSNVEQSSIAEEKSVAGVQEPIVRQTSLKGAAFLSPGKPLVLGSLDIPGSTRHLDVEVVMVQLP